MSERETPKLFDAIFKKLMELSAQAMINFINGLFGTSHAPDSAVEFPATEHITGGLKEKLLDVLILVNHKYLYHIEAQIDGDKNMVLRMFEYGLAVGLRNRTAEDGAIRVRFPEHRVIYWETTKKKPDYVAVKLELPGKTVDFKLKSVKFLDYSVEDL